MNEQAVRLQFGMVRKQRPYTANTVYGLSLLQ